jgi:hypothetical protein
LVEFHGDPDRSAGQARERGDSIQISPRYPILADYTKRGALSRLVVTRPASKTIVRPGAVYVNRADVFGVAVALVANVSLPPVGVILVELVFRDEVERLVVIAVAHAKRGPLVLGGTLI